MPDVQVDPVDEEKERNTNLPPIAMDKVKANQKSDADMLAGTDHGEPAHEESSDTSRGEETAKKSNELKYLL